MEMVYGHVFPLSSVWKYAGKWVIHEEKWMSVRNNQIGKMVSLYPIYS